MSNSDMRYHGWTPRTAKEGKKVQVWVQKMHGQICLVKGRGRGVPDTKKRRDSLWGDHEVNK